MNNAFSKSERLCGQTRIEDLYHNGKRFVVWPLRVTYRVVEDAPTRVLIWAPKSLFKHAVDRNCLRRRMREAYRLNKSLLTERGKTYEVAFNYMDKEIQESPVIHKAMRQALKRLAEME